MFGNELRASAAPQAAARCGSLPEPQIQDSKTAASVSAVSIPLAAAPQPSGRAASTARELQPSARGLLRAADVCDVEFAAKHAGNDRRHAGCRS